MTRVAKARDRERAFVLLKEGRVLDANTAKLRVVDGCLVVGDVYDDPDYVFAGGEWIRAWRGPAPS